MKLPNRDGKEVDAVPMLVAVCTAFLVGYAWGPLYFLRLGLTVRTSLVVVTVAFVAVSVAAYHQMVWTNHPGRRKHVPVELRLQRLFYAVLIGVGITASLGVPLVI